MTFNFSLHIQLFQGCVEHAFYFPLIASEAVIIKPSGLTKMLQLRWQKIIVSYILQIQSLVGVSHHCCPEDVPAEQFVGRIR
jgi:hypothetical protein